MRAKAKPKYNTFQNVGWMLSLSIKYCKRVIPGCIAVALVTVSLNLAQLFITPKILEKVEKHAPINELVLTIAVFTGITFLLMGLNIYLDELVMYGRMHIRSVAILSKVTDKTNGTSFQNLLDVKVKELLSDACSAMNSNADASEHIWITMTAVLSNTLGFIIYLILLSGLEPILVITVIVTAVLSFLISRRTDIWYFEHREERAKYSHQIYYIKNKSQNAKLAKDIRIFGLAPWLKDVHKSAAKLLDTLRLKNEKLRFLGNVGDVILAVSRNAIAYFYLINMTLEKNLSASEFLLYFTAVSGFTSWITGILKEVATLHDESLEVNSIREFLDYEEPFRFEGGVPIPDLSAGCKIELKNVSFKYPNAEENTIENINLTVTPGERLAVVGLNGAGKTTLIKVICGLLDPTEGSVLLNGIDIKEFNRNEYYKCLSTVFQDSLLLPVSVAQEVSQEYKDYDENRVKKCIELAGLTEKINELPNGINTKLDKTLWEDGVDLSGGQIQRLMLARALYRNSPILILDEPTAALDPLAENDIYNKYNEMTEGKTAFFVSHRLASTRFCDRIIFILNGKIAETGTHDELILKNGEYANLFEVQSRYYKEGVEF